MSHTIAAHRLNTELRALRQELRTLRSFLISVAGEDEEGAYRPQFIREILRAAKQKPVRPFRGVRSLLAEIRRA